MGMELIGSRFAFDVPAGWAREAREADDEVGAASNEALMGFARQAQAVVAQLLCLQTGSGQRRLDGHAQLLGMAHVFEQRRNRGEAERLHDPNPLIKACVSE